MSGISYVICAAGRGMRFRKAGLNIAKPKIKLQGKTMLERSLESFAFTPEDQVLVIGLAEDRLAESFSHLSGITWLELSHTTRGQLETYLLFEDHVKHEDIVIFNCDTFFKCDELVPAIRSGRYTGLIPCSQELGTSWSFCRVNEKEEILEVAEKKRISNWASVGCYYFRGRETLRQLGGEELKRKDVDEFYIAPVYNRYIERKEPLLMLPTQEFLPFGTIDQVSQYWGVSADELLAENS